MSNANTPILSGRPRNDLVTADPKLSYRNNYDRLVARPVLGMSKSAAHSKLRREIMWMLLVETGRTTCARCGGEMTAATWTIDHKVDWLHELNGRELFFALTNIQFSHARCNRPSGKKNRRNIPGIRMRNGIAIPRRYSNANKLTQGQA